MKPIKQSSIFKQFSYAVAVATLLALSMLTTTPQAQSAQGGEHWVGTWATALVPRLQTTQAPGQARQGGVAPQAGAPQGPEANGAQGAARGGAVPPLNFSNQTLRQVVHVSLGGSRVRVVVSNAFGTAPLTIGAAHLALRDNGSALVAQSDRALTFSGTSAMTVPPGASIVSDPVNLVVPPLADLVVDLYLPGDTAASPSPLTTHAAAHQTNYVSEPGNHAGATELPVASTTASWFFLARVEVVASAQTGAVAIIGDSVTDGSRSTDDTNNRWPDHLARRLNSPASAMKMGVLNLGIGGNRMLSGANAVSALARFDRDVLVQPGVTHVIVFEGINDIGGDANLDVADLIAAHTQLVERAHARGLKVYAATLTPVEATTGNFAAYSTPDKQAKRTALNNWIRTSKVYDGVIDFDATLRDPSHPTRVLPQYVSDDNLHPNDAGYQMMANAIDLALLRPAALPARTAQR